MKSKKITAWILFMAMLVTMMPSSLVLAAPSNGSPELVVNLYTQDSDMTEGDDLLYGIESTYDIGAGGVFNKTPQEITSGVWQNSDMASKELLPASKRMAMSIKAKSQGSGFGTGHKLWRTDAIQYTYLDLDKNALHEEDDGTMLNISSGVMEWHNYAELMTYSGTIEEFNKDDSVRLSKVAAVNQQLVDDKGAEVVIWNIIKKEFSGYIRVKVTDIDGKSTIQDVLVIADGNYPEIEVTSQTEKNKIGEVNSQIYDVQIDGRKFISAKNLENTEIISDWKDDDDVISDSDMKAEIESMKNGNGGYVAHDYWATEDIKLSIVATDSEMSSELKSVKWNVYNYPNTLTLIPTATDTSIVTGSIMLDTYRDIDTDITEGAEEIDVDDASTNDLYKKTIIASDYLPGNAKGYDPQITEADLTIPETAEGFNVLVVTVEDVAGLKATNYYYYFIDNTNPNAKFEIVELDKNVVSLFTVADVVTNRQQAIDMSASDDVTASANLISGLEDATVGETEKNKMYQYRLLATKEGAAEGGNVPDGYTATVLDKEGNDLSGWKIWTGETETPVIYKEFDGIIQVRVQDRAGNWSPIVSTTSDGKETIITDNTNPVIDVKEYALNSNADTTGNTADEIINGTATDILVTTARVTEKTDGEIENEVIHTTTGDVAPWINDSAVLEVKITDEDIANEIRSSGLNKGQINVKAEFNAENENKKIKIWNKNGVDKKNVDDSFNLTEDYIFGTETDKDLTFYIEYEGTGVVDITVSVKDQADVNDGDVFSSIYKTQLRVDKINPYIIYKGYDITDDAEKDLLKANNEKVDYEVRNMPWGPNSQVLEVVVKDDDITPVQSKTKNVKFNADKALDLYKISGDTFTKVKTYAAGNNNIVSLGDCEELANEKYESNVGYKFYLVYEGTGIAKVEFFADDSAKEPNVRDYPSVATAADADPVLYDAMLRVDKINPEIKNAKLVETDTDVEDKGWLLNLFTFNETDADVNTRKQMKITFEIVDETTTAEQSGVNIQNEKISGVDLIDVYDKYVEKDKTHLYDNEATAYITDDANDVAVDPNIDYILLPVESGSINGTGGTFTQAASASNEDIEALVAKYLDKEYNADGDKCEWKKAAWKDGGIVVPDEFQGAIVLRTIDRVGNIDYSEPITFVAESREALIDFEPQNGYIWSQNNYGWSKRDYDYVEIRVKDDNEEKVDAWLENVFISVTDLEGNDISTKDTVKFAHKIHADDASLEVDPSAYTYVSLSDFTNEAAYGYDVIDNDGLVEKLARDTEGYIHLGYVRVSESAQIKVTVFDKAKADNVEYTGNKTTGVWTSRIDRIAPTVNVKVVAIPASEHGLADNNKVVLGLKADIIDSESGVAPAITDDTYNVYTPENVPATGVFASDKSFLYKVTNDSDVEIERFNKGTFNTRQYELPGLQYALIPENGDLEDVMPWDFETAPDTIYDENGYNGKMGATNVWHNYIDDKTPILPADGFDGYVVVRAIDKAGNITVIGCAPTIDIEAAEGWQKETQFIQVKASAKTGNITKIEYTGNNNLLTHDEEGNVTTRDITAEAASGEGTFIEVAEEGITDVIITASEEYTTQQTVKAANDERNATWEGSMIIGNATTAGYEDFKFQTVQVKIDKTAPTFEFALVDAADNEIVASSKGFGIKVVDGDEIVDPIPNLPDVVGYRSHTPSGIAKVEYCVANEGMEEWIEVDKATWETGVIKAYADNEAITGTVKVRVTDNAGNVTEKSKAINIDSALPIISISNDSTGKCSHDPVTVFVTVSESAEFSDVVKVVYTLNDGAEKELTLNGGTITVDKEGTTKVKVTATNKAGESETAETIVEIHYADLGMPTIEGRVSGEWITGTTDTTKVTVNSDYDFRYSVNGSDWKYVDITTDEKTIELATGKNTIRLQAFDADCLCESDVNTYIINYDNGTPKITIAPGTTISTNESAVAMIIANKGTCASEIKSLTYDLVRVAGSEYEPVETGRHLSPNGGNIVIASEGQWSINNIKVTMESGIEFTSPDNILVTVDKSAPELVANLTSNGEKADIALFALQETQTGYDLTVKATDAFSSQVKIEYAAVAEGDAYPDWVTQTVNSGEERVFEDVIKNAFKGSFVVKATDALGNTSVWTKNVFTEGVAPEISVTAPSSWQTEDIMMNVDVVDKGLSSTIESVKYTLYNGADTTGTKVGEGELSSIGGSIEITREGTTTVEIIAKDYAGNEAKATSTVKLDKTAPEYSRMIQLLGVYNEHEIPESEWNIIHDGWTYNHDVSLDGIKDIHSGIKKVNIKFTSADGATTETTLNSSQTSSSFSESGKYDLTLIDNAGNVRNISFAINKDLQNVINVIGVDALGKLNIAVTDGDDMLTFYKKENSESKYSKMYNGITDQLVDGKTGVRYIYGQNDSGKKSNTLYVIVAPSTEYGISLMSLNATPNRYLNIDAEGGNVTVKKIDEIFNPGINKNISVGSVVEINEDGVYSITTND